jgi:glutamate racemase
MLDINKVKSRLGWKPRLNMQLCMSLVADWYKKYKSQIRLISCPGLVEKIESNFPLFYREIISEYIPQNLEKTNQVVLGCTHYEFLSSVFE